ncbi:MAG TPA: prepilin peptidase [Gammaproteobacteria bacterium]|nr:prepilin peptidase [Gammaproteobacteria bacterium]
MSDLSARTWTLPSPVLYPERKQPRPRWTDRLETAVTGWPVVALPRLRQARLKRIVRSINRDGVAFAAMDDPGLRNSARSLRRQLRRHGLRDSLVSKSFALVREVAARHIGLRHFDVQLQGGYGLLKGMVVEMDTGEGKTLTATLAAGTAALAGIPVHIVTVNDYLAARDAQTMGPLYRALGLRVGTVVHGISPPERREAYACDVTYASNKEITFDYLRDRLALGPRSQNLRLKLERLQGRGERLNRVVMRGLHFAIVDEADSVLIDEARTPLIISGETDASDERQWAEGSFQLADELTLDNDYRILRDERRIELTDAGRRKLAQLGEDRGGIWRSRIRREESARQALTARHLFLEGEHYLLRDGKVQIVDEYTGRIMEDRSWSEGLHQLVELKEGCEVTGRKVPLARITYQRFFRRYRRLAGMTGTAREGARELWSVFNLAVARVPTNRPLRRRRLPARVYPTLEDKWQAITDRVRELNRNGRPVLIGTRSVKASETVSEWLGLANLDHVVLSAAQDQDEAEIIARAGEARRITVATNMAGRGVDIRLGPGVTELGGLHVILTERHDAGRIDRQLEGRCGRQGDPGTTECILSLEDPLLDIVDAPALTRLARGHGRATWPAAMLFNKAQRKAERVHSRARRELVRMDQKLGTLLAFSGGME